MVVEYGYDYKDIDMEHKHGREMHEADLARVPAHG